MPWWVNIHVDLVGGGFQQLPGSRWNEGKIHMRWHGLLQREQLGSILKEATLGIAPIGSHNIMQQGCSLKVREYMARSLPFVYGYDDVDLDRSETDAFARQVPNDESLLSVDELCTFAEQVSQDSSTCSRMRDYAIRKMDWRLKMRAYHDFAQQLLRKG